MILLLLYFTVLINYGVLDELVATRPGQWTKNNNITVAEKKVYMVCPAGFAV